MALAFVLINCELGSEEKVISEIKELKDVVEVIGTYGAYDMIVKIETDNVEKLREIITWNIRKIPRIRSTLTLMNVANQ